MFGEGYGMVKDRRSLLVEGARNRPVTGMLCDKGVAVGSRASDRCAREYSSLALSARFDFRGTGPTSSLAGVACRAAIKGVR